MDRGTTLLSVVFTVAVVAVFLLNNPRNPARYPTYYGVVSDTCSTVNTPDGKPLFTVTVFGPDDSLMNRRTSWYIPTDTRDIEQHKIRPGQRVEFRYLNELHNAINIIRYFQ